MKIQSSIIDETIELVDKDGHTLKTVPFRLDIAATIQQITDLRVRLGDVDKTNLEEVGKITIDLFRAVFGEKTMGELLDYYQDNYIALVTDLTPMLTDHIFPAIDSVRENLVATRKRLKR